MPRISNFYGIVIWMYFNEHNPPHFHATYGEYEIIDGVNDNPTLQAFYTSVDSNKSTAGQFRQQSSNFASFPFAEMKGRLVGLLTEVELNNTPLLDN